MSGLDKIVAQNVEYDNTVSGMTADDVQEAIDEIGAASITINAKVQYFANLPAAASHSGETYYVEEYSSNAGVDYLSGLYLSNGTSWTFRDDKVVYSLNAFTGTNKILKTNDTNKEIVETLVEIDSNNNLDLKSGGLKDTNVSTAVKLGSATDTSLNTTKKDILGGINENKSNIDLRALDSAVVHKTGDETIDGIKTFSNFPITPSSAPTTDYQVANKKYVDGKGIPDYDAGSTVTPDETSGWTAPASGMIIAIGNTNQYAFGVFKDQAKTQRLWGQNNPTNFFISSQFTVQSGIKYYFDISATTPVFYPFL